MSGEIESTNKTSTVLPQGGEVIPDGFVSLEDMETALEIARAEKEQAVKNAWKDAELSAKATVALSLSEWDRLLADVRGWARTAENARQVYKDDMLYMDFNEAQEATAKTQVRILRKIEDEIVERMKSFK